jgi:hypothetical protein
MSIDPRVALIIKIVLALATAIAGGGLPLAGIVSPQTAALIVAIASSLTVVLGIILTAYSSSTPGPLAPQDAPVVAAATALSELPPSAAASVVASAKSAVVAAAAAHV